MLLIAVAIVKGLASCTKGNVLAFRVEFLFHLVATEQKCKSSATSCDKNWLLPYLLQSHTSIFYSLCTDNDAM